MVPLTYDNLTILENVTLIVGSVKIDVDSPLFRNLSFLRNLKTVMANRPLQVAYIGLLPICCLIALLCD